MTSSTPKTMAVSIVAGTNGLIQLGLSISDLALLIDQGKKFGNFVRAAQNESDLFDLLSEEREALLKRDDFVDAREMEKRWPGVNFVYHGVKVKGNITQSLQTGSSVHDSKHPRKKTTTRDDVNGFTWVMVAITSALDDCLPSTEIQELLIQVFVEVLDRKNDIALALRTHIKRSVESWRSFGCAREIAHSIKKEMRKSLSKGAPDQLSVHAVPQLNETETQDVKNMLVWLLRGDTAAFDAMSPIAFSMAEAWKQVGLDLCTDGLPIRESQACVLYRHEDQLAGGLNSSASLTLQISWPRDKPESMIDVLGAGRTLKDAMLQAWQYGKDAADHLE